jgi:GNAT superfamily N-acetyltransferase
MSYQEISISHRNGSAEGYVVSSDAQNVKNFLEREVGCEVGAQIAGFLKGKTGNVAIFKSLHVDEKKRGKGIGSDLVGQFFDEAGDVDAVLLIADAHESQRKGFSLEAFYEGFDFESVIGTSAGPLMVYPTDLAEEVREFITSNSHVQRPSHRV